MFILDMYSNKLAGLASKLFVVFSWYVWDLQDMVFWVTSDLSDVLWASFQFQHIHKTKYKFQGCF